MATIGPLQNFQTASTSAKLARPSAPPQAPESDAPAAPSDRLSIGFAPTVPLPVSGAKLEAPKVEIPKLELPKIEVPQFAPLPMSMSSLQVSSRSGQSGLFMEEAPAAALPEGFEQAARAGMLGGLFGGVAAGLQAAGQQIGGLIGKIAGRAPRAEILASPEKLKQVTSSPYALALKETAGSLASLPPGQVKGAYQMLESALLDPKATVVEKKHLGGGINGTFIVTLSNGARGVFKPTAAEDQSKLRTNLEEDHQGKREEAAYLVDKAMDHLGRVPPTVRRTIEGQEGALMLFVPDSEVAAGSGKVNATMSKVDGYRRMAILDNVIGNLDRHEGNWMVSKDGQPLPIDHGLAFPWKNDDQGFMNFDFQQSRDLSPEDLQAVKNLSEQRGPLAQRLSTLLEKPAIEAMFERVDSMLSEGKTSTWWHGKNSKVGWDR